MSHVTRLLILLILMITCIILFQLNRINVIQKFGVHKTMNYSYYVCAQIMNEPEAYLIEWIEYQLNVIGFKNICLINVGENFLSNVLSRYSISIINKKERMQEFHLCLSCFNPAMKPSDLLFIQDIDEFLNVRQADIISKNYDQYDKFHFQEIRYGTKRELTQDHLISI